MRKQGLRGNLRMWSDRHPRDLEDVRTALMTPEDNVGQCWRPATSSECPANQVRTELVPHGARPSPPALDSFCEDAQEWLLRALMAADHRAQATVHWKPA